jgi:hypothetical protein
LWIPAREVEEGSYYLEMFAAGQVGPVEIHYSICLTIDLFIHQVGKRINDSMVNIIQSIHLWLDTAGKKLKKRSKKK